jgi:hypothetical protein
MLYLFLFVFFIVFPYEYVLFGEDVLFGISFAIFVYYIINSVSEFFYSALEARKVYVLNLFKFYFTFLVSTLNDLLQDLAYFTEANLDKNFVSSLASLLTVIDYSSYVISTDLEFSEEDRNLVFSEFVNSVNVQYETESTVLDYFNK